MAYFWGPPMIVISLFVFLSLRIQNSDHFRTAILIIGGCLQSALYFYNSWITDYI